MYTQRFQAPVSKLTAPFGRIVHDIGHLVPNKALHIIQAQCALLVSIGDAVDGGFHDANMFLIRDGAPRKVIGDINKRRRAFAYLVARDIARKPAVVFRNARKPFCPTAYRFRAPSIVFDLLCQR